MYVAVKGGEAAIANAHRLLADRRRGDRQVPGLRLDQIVEHRIPEPLPPVLRHPAGRQISRIGLRRDNRAVDRIGIERGTGRQRRGRRQESEAADHAGATVMSSSSESISSRSLSRSTLRGWPKRAMAR